MQNTVVRLAAFFHTYIAKNLLIEIRQIIGRLEKWKRKYHILRVLVYYG